jgi:hypothetical protein
MWWKGSRMSPRLNEGLWGLVLDVDGRRITFWTEDISNKSAPLQPEEPARWVLRARFESESAVTVDEPLRARVEYTDDELRRLWRAKERTADE